MKDTQFTFSVSVGVTLAIFGGLIATADPIGFPLMGIATLIIALAVLSKRKTAQQNVRLQPIFLKK